MGLYQNSKTTFNIKCGYYLKLLLLPKIKILNFYYILFSSLRHCLTWISAFCKIYVNFGVLFDWVYRPWSYLIKTFSKFEHNFCFISSFSRKTSGYKKQANDQNLGQDVTRWGRERKRFTIRSNPKLKSNYFWTYGDI